MRRRDIMGLWLLAAGSVPAYTAFVALGNRVFPTATIARDNDMSHAAVYFLGPEGNSPPELGLVLAWIAIWLIGMGLVAVGYRLVTTDASDEPALRPVDVPSVWHRFDV